SSTEIRRNAGTGTLSLGVQGNTTFTDAGFGGKFTNTTGNVAFLCRGAGSANAQWDFSSGGTVTLSALGGSITFGSLSGTEGIGSMSSSRAARVVVGNLGMTTSYSGVIGSANGSVVGLYKIGTGALTLSAANLYAGQALTAVTGVATVLGQGTLIL